MAWVTAIGPSGAQVEYRLTGRHGCVTADSSMVFAAPAVEAIKGLAAARGVDAAALFSSDRQRGIWGRVSEKSARQTASYRIKASTAEGLLRSVGLDAQATYGDAMTKAQRAESDPRVAYRMDANERPLLWIGSGLSEVGLSAGDELTPDQWDMARAMMRGVHPRTGEALVDPKQAADPRSKLAAQPLIKAIRDLAEARNTVPRNLLNSQRRREIFERMERGVERLGQAHRVRIGDIGNLADALGIDTASLYGSSAVEVALSHEDERVTVGNQGYDLTLTMPKAFSVLTAFADSAMAAELEEVFLSALTHSVHAAEGWTAYGMRGHHGDQQSAERVESTGFMGWVNVHRTARPVGDAPFGDPHMHAHVTLANLCKGTDGKWSTIAAGGRDLYRHASAIDSLMQAQIRAVTQERWGIEWQRSERTGVWEITGIPPESIDLFSKRRNEVRELFKALGMDYNETTTAMQKAAAARIANSKRDEASSAPDAVLRAYWRAEAEAAEQDPDAILGAALRPPHIPPTGVPPAVPPRSAVDIDAVAAWVFRTDEGLTAHRKSFTRAEALAAVTDAASGGLRTVAEAEELTDRVLAHRGLTIRLDTRLPAHLANTQRYTTADIVAAERTILHQARSRFATDTAVVSEDTFTLTVATYEAMEQAANPAFALSDEQLRVLRRVLRDGHGVDAVIGVAGAGKTTIMQVARMAWEAEGRIVRGASTAAVAAANLRMEAGIDSGTVAMLVHRLSKGQQPLRGIDALVLDEAAMIDDRHLALLLAHAAETGTKVLGIGDPRQLQSPGVGGSFEGVHAIVGGLTLTTNYRQRDQIERRALELWRNEERREALRLWAEHGHVHAAGSRTEAVAAMLTAWQHQRTQYADVHDQIAQVLLLATRNADVDELSIAARAMRREQGEIGALEHEFALAGGSSIAFSVGDIVLIRQNDYRGRTSGGHDDVLNGFRGHVVALDDHHGVQVEWREKTADGGHRLIREWLDGDYIAAGGLSHGIAMTVHKAQGLSADRALIYGPGLAGTGAYTAMSRDKIRMDLFLPRDIVEDEETRVMLGEPQTDEEAIQRVLSAFAESMDAYDPDERLIVTELGEDLDPLISTEAEASAAEDSAVWTTERHASRAADARTIRFVSAAQAAGLDADRLTADPAWEALAEALEATEDSGLDATEALRAAVNSGSIEGISSPAAILAWRIDNRAPGAGGSSARDSMQAAEAAAEPYAADPVHTPGAGLEASDDGSGWTYRMYGHLTEDELNQAIGEAASQAREASIAHAQAAARAERQTAQLASGQGESEAALMAHADELHTRAEAIAELGTVVESIEQTGVQVIELRSELAALESTPARRRDREARAAQASALREQLAAAQRQGVELDMARERLDRAAGPAVQHPGVMQQWRVMCEQLPQLRETARRSDIENAERSGAAMAALRERARQAAARRDELAAERDLRSALVPDEQREESRQREIARHAVSRQQQEQAATHAYEEQAWQQHRDSTAERGQSI
ncbi:MobF family relaxase [Streptomyces sp. NPDC059193]|uniref:MobF family relaxase n=1 Tax=Streptomyces sp. NPDC059193 TaxID=3346763 RepID=UPI00369D93C1